MTEETPRPSKAIYHPPSDQPNLDEPYRWFNLLPVAYTGPIHRLLIGPERLLHLDSREKVDHERTTRDVALNSLDDFYELAPPDENATMLRGVWEQRSKFCLYLRSYDFATRVVGTATPQEAAPPFGEMIAVNPTHDIRLLQLTQKVLGCAPLISVVNPLDPPSSIGQFRYHDSEWRPRVQELIAAAQVIVMYLRGAESGVAEEIQMIRRTRREENTILVLGEEDVFSAVRTLSMENAIESTDARWDLKRQARTDQTNSPPDGFPFVLTYGSQDFEDAVTAATRLLNVDTNREFAAGAPLPTVPFLVEEETQLVIQHGIEVLNRARTFLAYDRLLSAEAWFQAAWAFFFAVGATRHRASVALELGRFYLVTVGDPNRAAKRLRESARLYRRLNVPTMLMTASQELALACIGIDPPAIDEARLSVEEAERLIEFDPSPWSRFTIAHARESVEDAAGNSAGAADARAVALRYYGEYRDAGGTAPTPEAQWIDEIRDAFVKGGRPDAHTFLSQNPVLAELPRVRKSLIAVVEGSEHRDMLLANTASAAAHWELSNLIDILIGRTNEA
jgi:tetratricopeptide (TPR) repeat protein